MFDRSKVWAMILLAAVFAAGAVAGWGLQAWADTRDPRRGGRGRGVDAIVANLTAELALTPVQQESVRAVFVRRKAAMDALWETVHPQFDSLRAQMRAEVSAVLTPEQLPRYRAIIEENDRRRHGGSDTANQQKR